MKKVKSIEPKQFFDEFVAQRQPVILEDLEYASTLQTSLVNSLDNQAKVCVEKLNGSYGQGDDRITLPLGELLSQFKNGNPNQYYMTTQYQESLDCVSNPLKNNPNVDLNYDLFGHLSPVLVNCWMGSSTSKTSSGLHHDYHDNFYFLVKGVKEFCVFPPECAPDMYLNGEIRRIHSNGLIEYTDSPQMRADGALLVDVSRLAVQKAEEAVESATTQKETLAAEEALDAALENMLEFDDDEASLDGETLQDILGSDLEFGSDSEEEEEVEVPYKKTRISGEPPHFSQVKEVNHPGECFPKFPTSKAIKFTLKAGQVLYLPAGWFHEVSSSGTEQDPMHVALNYWFAPPTESCFESPYVDSFWVDS